MKRYKYPKRKNWAEILKRPALEKKSLKKIVEKIFREVHSNGDKAVLEYTHRFDHAALKSTIVTKREFGAASKQVDKKLKDAINIAKKNIEKFHASQKATENKLETTKGVTCWRKTVPIEKVGLYIPGGSAPLFSTVLMLGIPAKLAGCKEIILCTPPNEEGKIHPAILYTAAFIGIKKIFKAGGVQAIAAMTFGTATIPQVHKIFGPGNQYVTAAKMFAFEKGIAIDMPAGPSEVLVVADESAEPSFIAADLLSQAEHGADSQVIFVSLSEKLIGQVNKEIELQLKALPRKNIASKSLHNSSAILVKHKKEAVEIINEYAPEHLILSVKESSFFIEHVVNAGSVFIGNYTPESAGDYASGTNHTLPTQGFARSYGGVSLDSFVKKITYQQITEKGIKNIGSTIETMAEAEELIAHKNAVSLRLKKLTQQ